MNRLASFFLVFLLVVSATELKQLFKLNSLLDHYSAHQSKRSDLTFGDFLYMHYVGDDADTSDDKQDKELPFKDSGDASINIVSVVPVNGYGINDQRPITEQPRSDCKENLSFYHASFWQPPRRS